MVIKSTHRNNFPAVWLLPVLTFFTLFSTASAISPKQKVTRIDISHDYDQAHQDKSQSENNPSLTPVVAAAKKPASKVSGNQRKKEKAYFGKKMRAYLKNVVKFTVASAGLALSAYQLVFVARPKARSQPLAAAPLPIVPPAVQASLWDKSIDDIYAHIFERAKLKERELIDKKSDLGDKADISPDRQLVAAIKACQALFIGSIEISIYSSQARKSDPNGEKTATDFARCMVRVDRALAQGADPNTIVDCGGVHANTKNLFGYRKDERYFVVAFNENLATRYPAWIFAIRIGCPYPMVKKLIDGGAQINVVEQYGNNALNALYDYYGGKNGQQQIRNYGNTRDALSILDLLIRRGIGDPFPSVHNDANSFLCKQYIIQHQKKSAMLAHLVCRRKNIPNAYAEMIRKFFFLTSGERAGLDAGKPVSDACAADGAEKDGDQS